MCFFYDMGLSYSHVVSSHCLQIAHFKIPRHVRFMADFPKTVSGKIQKFALQKMVLEEGTLETGWTDLDTHVKGFVKSKTVHLREHSHCGGWFVSTYVMTVSCFTIHIPGQK